MGMIQLNIADEDRQILAEHPHLRVQRKMEAVYLTSMGVSQREVARFYREPRGRSGRMWPRRNASGLPCSGYPPIPRISIPLNGCGSL